MIRIKDLLNEGGKALVSSGGTAIYLTDGSAVTLGVNRAYERLTEIEEREVIGRHMHDLEEARFFDRSVSLLVLKTKAPITISQRVLRTSKKVVVTGNPVFNQAGDVIYVITSVYPREFCNDPPQHQEHPPVSFTPMDNMVAASKVMQNVFLRAVQVAAMDATVLILGESGVGKGVLATVVHQFSSRRNKAFVKVNMTAIPEELFESELFGYRGGSFTGALKTGKPGFLQAASGGTLFLDEISEVSPRGQAKLLKVIEDKEIYRVGSTIPEQVDVRFVAASNRNLKDLVSEGKFREDLFYRLSTIEIRVPGLTDRPEDIPILIQHFLKKYAQAYGKTFQGLTRRAQIVLLQHDWPGNVRELENVISSAAITANADFIDVGDLPEHLQKPQRAPVMTGENWRPIPLDEVRSVHIQRVLEMCNGNRVRAAQMLGIGRTSLYRFLKRTNRMAAAKGAA